MYGDLSATIAAILLDQEARSIILDADPFHGALREPVLRVMALMRSMELRQSEKQPIIKIDGLATRIGQMAHAFPTVFSFFLPEYSPDGRPGEATLVAPETMILDMPKIGKFFSSNTLASNYPHISDCVDSSNDCSWFTQWDVFIGEIWINKLRWRIRQ